MNDQLLNIFEKVERYHWWFVGRRFLIKSEIENYFSNRRNLKILDIGCGTGGTIPTLKKYGKVFGIDNSSLAVKIAKKQKFTNIKKASATKLPYPDSSFDVVLALDVFEHIKDDKKALMEAKRVLKKNGIIILTTPALPLIWSDYDVNQKHFRRYTKKRFNNLSKSCGLKINRLSYFNFILASPIIVVRVLSRISIFNNLSDYDSSLNFKLASFNPVNSILSSLFISELKVSKYVNYPIGISLVTVLSK